MKAKLLVYDDNGHPLDIVDAHRCDSKDHEPRAATILMHWVTGPVEYCAPCAARMRAIADALDVYVHEQPILVPCVTPHRRAIDLKGGVARHGEDG